MILSKVNFALLIYKVLKSIRKKNIIYISLHILQLWIIYILLVVTLNLYQTLSLGLKCLRIICQDILIVLIHCMQALLRWIFSLPAPISRWLYSTALSIIWLFWLLIFAFWDKLLLVLLVISGLLWRNISRARFRVFLNGVIEVRLILKIDSAVDYLDLIRFLIE